MEIPVVWMYGYLFPIPNGLDFRFNNEGELRRIILWGSYFVVKKIDPFHCVVVKNRALFPNVDDIIHISNLESIIEPMMHTFPFFNTKKTVKEDTHNWMTEGF